MEMDKALTEYLEKVDRYLRPMVVSERVDIVQEIKSEMLELLNDGFLPEQILQRLGTPKELAKAYLGENIVKGAGFGWRRVSAVIAFYSLAGIGGMFVLPLTIEEIGLVIGNYSASAALFLPVSALIGGAIFLVGWLFWKLTIAIIRAMSQGMKRLAREGGRSMHTAEKKFTAVGILFSLTTQAGRAGEP